MKPSESCNLARIPVTEVAALLRLMGQHLVKDLLVAGPAHSAPDLFELVSAEPTESAVLALAEALSADSLSSMHTMVTCPPIQDRKVEKAHNSSFRKLVADLLNEDLRIEEFDRQQRQLLLDILGISDYLLLPNLLLPLAGVIAWMDLQFQYQMAYEVRKFLLPQVLFYPDDIAEPAFVPGTFWALIAQANIASGNRRRSVHVPQAWLSKALRSLHQVSLQLACHADWSGGWDRWLVTRSFNTWRTNADAHCRKLQEVIPEAPKMEELL
jgi:hypothetical protein